MTTIPRSLAAQEGRLPGLNETYALARVKLRAYFLTGSAVDMLGVFSDWYDREGVDGEFGEGIARYLPHWAAFDDEGVPHPSKLQQSVLFAAADK
ncbi:hypothetical protein Hypma_007313 [Hypsizygus marmoreus]|uniref:Uncharacterized protein n=1 Tax=Hypsizygus marmoreus TaxID=39966 RepID=A0A369KA35_HYPMA|nr:hypothetical protein Hypma_007313 [Hypsizygus marmoreus]